MLFLYLVVVNYVHLRFLGLPLDLWGVGGGGWFAKSFLGSMLPQYMAIVYSHKYKINQGVMVGGRQPLVEDDFCWKTTFIGRQLLGWKMTFDGRQP